MLNKTLIFKRCNLFFANRRFLQNQACEALRQEVGKFNVSTPVQSAITPPSTWFFDPYFQELDKEAIFKQSWIVAGRSDIVAKPGEFFSEFLYSEPLLIARDKDAGELRGFYNACRHHAAQLTDPSQHGKTDKFVCPYHGWTYSTNGQLVKATKLRGIENFRAKDFGLKQFKVSQWGPTILVNLKENAGDNDLTHYTRVMQSLEQEFGPFDTDHESGLVWIASTAYDMKCNWKVFVDNYLDGGYHVDVLHKDLTAGLAIDSYKTEVHENYSIQRVRGGGNDDRLGGSAFYAYIFPNFMINRYGPWLDTNLVVPTGPSTSKVIYNYYLEKKFLQNFAGNPEEEKKFIDDSLVSSNQVQEEDTFVCESVQRGLQSSGYDVGRYAPRVEQADHAFHVKLATMYRQFLGI